MDYKTLLFIDDTSTGYLVLCPYCQSEIDVKSEDINCPNCNHTMYYPDGASW